MTVLLITALRAAETLTAFPRQRVENAAGATRVYSWTWLAGAQRTRSASPPRDPGYRLDGREPGYSGSRRDPEKTHRITDRHPVMHGIGMLLKDVAQARVEMARDIADALAAERVWALPTRRPSYLP
jgi:hypothetical protein